MGQRLLFLRDYLTLVQGIWSYDFHSGHPTFQFSAGKKYFVISFNISSCFQNITFDPHNCWMAYQLEIFVNSKRNCCITNYDEKSGDWNYKRHGTTSETCIGRYQRHTHFCSLNFILNLGHMDIGKIHFCWKKKNK